MKFPWAKSVIGFLSLYQPQQWLSEGHSANVMLAKNVQTGSTVVVKIAKINDGTLKQEYELLRELNMDLSLPSYMDEQLKYWIAEGKTKIPTPLAFTETDGRPMIVLPYAGISIDAYDAESWSYPLLKSVTKQIMEALVFLNYRNCIHSDVKPANILISKGRVQLIDFGCFTELNTPIVGGDVNYMSPESLADHSRPLTASHDVFGVGMTLLTLVSGENVDRSRLPLHEPLALQQFITRSIKPKMKWHESFNLAAFITFCLNADPAKRPSPVAGLRHPFLQ
jgi:serine/threonine protein kinase